MPVVSYTSLTSTSAQLHVSGHQYFELCPRALSASYMELSVLQYSVVSTKTLLFVVPFSL
jgi:hypothetical protein